MRAVLIFVFGSILISMISVTTFASLDRSVFNVGQQLLFDRWFQATLCDAYFGFITFYIWVWYKENRFVKRAVWFVLIMLLGNIAMSVYVLIQIRLLPENATLGNLLVNSTDCDARSGNDSV